MSTHDRARAVVARRLGTLDVERDIMPGRLRATMPAGCFIVRPGLLQLEPWDAPDDRGPYLQMAQHSAPDSLGEFLNGWSDGIAAVQVLTLEAREWGYTVDVDVHELAPLRIDTSGKWKRHPPSKRKRMASWRRASNREKLRHKPLVGRFKSVPWWAQHPDWHRTERLGCATVVQRLRVYAQSGADISGLMDEHSREWVGTVVDALARPRREA